MTKAKVAIVDRNWRRREEIGVAVHARHDTQSFDDVEDIIRRIRDNYESFPVIICGDARPLLQLRPTEELDRMVIVEFGGGDDVGVPESVHEWLRGKKDMPTFKQYRQNFA